MCRETRLSGMKRRAQSFQEFLFAMTTRADPACAPFMRTVAGLTFALAAAVPAANVEPASAASIIPHKVGLGRVLTTSDGGQIYGFDIDQNGGDGVLSSAGYDQGGNFFVSVETFDQDTGKITRSFAKKNSARNSY